ncbi:MAG: histone family protein [Euryarchaeota archaeon]|nr:histone family protein [Euryarchaeota archaeon]
MAELPAAPLDRLMRKAGCERVSADAVKTLIEVLEGCTTAIAREASNMAKHAGRKTVTGEDVKLAAKAVCRA